MKKTKFITGLILLLMLITGLSSGKTIYADTSKVKFTISLESGQSIEGGLVLDLYKVADIVWDGSNQTQTTYLLSTTDTSPFKAFNGKNVGINKDTGKPWDNTLDLDKMAVDAAKIVFKEPKMTADLSANVGTENSLNTGMYLAIARSGNVQQSDTANYLNGDFTSFAYSRDKTYTFKPLLVFVYGDNAEAIDLSKKDNDNVLIKYSVDVRYGQLNVAKIVSVYGGRKTNTKLYISVKGYDKSDKLIYKKNFAIEINKVGPYDPIELKDIPVGTKVVVTEEYPGASYEFVSAVYTGTSTGTVSGQTVTVAEITPVDNTKIQTVTFTNKYNNIPITGYGVKNTMTYTETEVEGTTKGSWDICNDLTGKNACPVISQEAQ